MIRVFAAAVLVIFASVISPSSIPNWLMIAAVVVLIGAGMAISVRQKRIEMRWMRSAWRALTRR